MSEDSQLCFQIDSILARLDRRMEEAKNVTPIKENHKHSNSASRNPLLLKLNKSPDKTTLKANNSQVKSAVENESAQERAQKIGEIFFSSLGGLLSKSNQTQIDKKPETIQISDHYRNESFGKVAFVQEVKLAEAVHVHHKQASYGGNRLQATDSILKSLSKSPIRDRSSNRSESPFQPQLSKKSLLIAKKLGSAKERLTNTPTREALNSTETLTFKPEINKRSERIVSKISPNVNKNNRWEMLYNKGNEQKAKLEKKRKEAEDAKIKDDKECTFRPNITPIKERPEGSNTVERLLNWGRIKEQKIKQKRDNDVEKDLEGCTFVPQINEIKFYQEESTAGLRGVNKFLDRQAQARKLKEEKFGVFKEEYIQEIESATNSAYMSTMSKDLTLQDFTEAIESLHDELHSFPI